MQISACLVVGAGGTGSHLIEPLSRLLMFHAHGTYRILIADGDTFEPKNQVRQLFHKEDVGRNKAVAIAKRLSFAPNIAAVADYLNEDKFREVFFSIGLLPNDLFLMVLAVDNDRSRQVLINTLDEVHQNYIIINPGNLYDTAMCSCYAKLDGEEKMPSLEGRYHNIANPQDRIPNSCGEETPSTPQLITANKMAACLSLMMLSNILDDEPVPQEINANLRAAKVRSTGEAVRLTRVEPRS